jgi:hypothetical protein
VLREKQERLKLEIRFSEKKLWSSKFHNIVRRETVTIVNRMDRPRAPRRTLKCQQKRTIESSRMR